MTEIRPGYKQTEVGVIPEDWVITTIKAIGVKFLNGGTPSTKNTSYWAGHIPWITGADIVDQKVSEVRRYITQEAVLHSSTHVVESGNLLIATRTGVGKLAIAECDIAISQDLTGVYINTDMAVTEFVYLYLSFRKDMLMKLNQGTSIAGITRETLEQIPILLPGLAEQRAIAAALSDVDGLLTALAELIAKKRAIKQAAMQQLLTGQTRLPGFSGEWKKLAFDDVFSCINSKSFQIQTNEYHEWGVYPIVDQGKNLIAGYSDRIDKLLKCPPGGLIVFGDHTCIVKYVDFDFVVGADGTQILTATPGQILQFHAYQLVLSGVLPTGYNRHFKYLRDRTFFAPIENEQRAITSILADMDAEISALEAQRAKVQALKQGMLQELLTGRTRLV